MKTLTRDEKSYIKQNIRKAIDSYKQKLYKELEKLNENLEKEMSSVPGIKEYFDFAKDQGMTVKLNYNSYSTQYYLYGNKDKAELKLWIDMEKLDKKVTDIFDNICKINKQISETYLSYDEALESNLKKYYIEFSTWTGRYTERLDIINRLIDKVIKECYPAAFSK